MREYGSEQPVVVGSSYFQTIIQMKKHHALLRSGRESLMFTAANIEAEHKRILIPAYCCDSMEVPFENAGWKFTSYKLNEDLSIDMQHVADLIDEGGHEAILVMNYYGFNDLTESIQKIHQLRPGIKVIEDISHTLYDFEKDCRNGADYYVGSIRKTAGVNDGGIVLTDFPLIEIPEYEETDFVALRREAQRQKREYEVTKDAEVKRQFLGSLRKAENELDEFKTYHLMSAESLKQIYVMPVEDMSFRRKANYKHLNEILKDKCPQILTGGETQDGRTPFSIPILVSKDRDGFQRYCAQHGLYLPVLWPVRTDICKVATRYAEQMLSVPIDQRYDWDDMEEVGEILIKATEIYS